MRRNQLKRYMKGLWFFMDVWAWQKWFGAAVMGFAFALGLGNDFSLLQIQGLVIGMPFLLTFILYLIIYYYILRGWLDNVRFVRIVVPIVIASSYILLFVVLRLYGEIHL